MQSKHVRVFHAEQDGGLFYYNAKGCQEMEKCMCVLWDCYVYMDKYKLQELYATILFIAHSQALKIIDSCPLK